MGGGDALVGSVDRGEEGTCAVILLLAFAAFRH